MPDVLRQLAELGPR